MQSWCDDPFVKANLKCCLRCGGFWVAGSCECLKDAVVEKMECVAAALSATTHGPARDAFDWVADHLNNPKWLRARAQALEEEEDAEVC